MAKKYRHIRYDVQPIIERLQAGDLLGDRIPGTDYAVYKVRLKNSDIKKGKSAGYRVIYYIQTPGIVVLMTVYSKSEKSDISAEQIRQIISEFDEVSEE